MGAAIKAMFYTVSVWGMTYAWFTGHTVWFWLPACLWLVVASYDIGKAISPWADSWFGADFDNEKSTRPRQ